MAVTYTTLTITGAGGPTFTVGRSGPTFTVAANGTTPSVTTRGGTVQPITVAAGGTVPPLTVRGRAGGIVGLDIDHALLTEMGDYLTAETGALLLTA